MQIENMQKEKGLGSIDKSTITEDQDESMTADATMEMDFQHDDSLHDTIMETSTKEGYYKEHPR